MEKGWILNLKKCARNIFKDQTKDDLIFYPVDGGKYKYQYTGKDNDCPGENAQYFSVMNFTEEEKNVILAEYMRIKDNNSIRAGNLKNA